MLPFLNNMKAQFSIPQWIYDIMLDKAKLMHETENITISTLEAIHDAEIVIESISNQENVIAYQNIYGIPYLINAITFLKNYQREDFISYIENYEY